MWRVSGTVVTVQPLEVPPEKRKQARSLARGALENSGRGPRFSAHVSVPAGASVRALPVRPSLGARATARIERPAQTTGTKPCIVPRDPMAERASLFDVGLGANPELQTQICSLVRTHWPDRRSAQLRRPKRRARSSGDADLAAFVAGAQSLIGRHKQLQQRTARATTSRADSAVEQEEEGGVLSLGLPQGDLRVTGPDLPGEALPNCPANVPARMLGCRAPSPVSSLSSSASTCSSAADDPTEPCRAPVECDGKSRANLRGAAGSECEGARLQHCPTSGTLRGRSAAPQADDCAVTPIGPSRLYFSAPSMSGIPALADKAPEAQRYRDGESTVSTSSPADNFWVAPVAPGGAGEPVW